MDSSLSNYLNTVSGALLIPTILMFVGIGIYIVFLLKLWFALNDISKLRDMVDDINFRECARYESEKRRGLITTEDLDAAENLLK